MSTQQPCEAQPQSEENPMHRLGDSELAMDELMALTRNMSATSTVRAAHPPAATTSWL